MLGCEEKRITVGRYTTGMTLGDCQAIMTKPYPVLPAAIAYPPDTSRKEYAATEEFLLNVENEGVQLLFNHYKVLIRIVKRGP